MAHIIIDVNSDLDPITYPIDSESEERAARIALRDAGLAYASVWVGEPGSGDEIRTDRKLFAAPSNLDIETLKAEALDHGNDMQYCVCVIALEGPIDSYEDRFGGGGFRLTHKQERKLESLTQDEAVELCRADALVETEE